MSTAAKRRIAGVVTVSAALVMSFSMARMIPYGLAGDVREVKICFGIAMLAFIVGLISGILYYYFGFNDTERSARERQRVEIEALSELGNKKIKN